MRTPLVAFLRILLKISQTGGTEYGYDGHTVEDLAAEDHLDHLLKRKGSNLDEFGMVRVELELRQVFSDKEVSRLIHDAFAGVVGRKPTKIRCPVSDLFSQLSLRSLLERLARVNPSRWRLPCHSFCHITVLFDEQNIRVIDKRKYTDAITAGDNPVNPRPSIRQPNLVLPQ